MQIMQYTSHIIPTSKYCVFYPHEQHEPYVGSLNYSKISLPNIKRYCEVYDIDLVTLTNFNRKYYKNIFTDTMRQAQCTDLPFIVLDKLITQYQYILVYMSDFLIKKNMPHFKEFIENNINCVVPSADGGIVSMSTPFTYEYYGIIGSLQSVSRYPLVNKDMVYSAIRYYKTQSNAGWWSGPGIIVNYNMKQWFNLDNIKSYLYNDMAYRYIQYYKDPSPYINIESRYQIQQFNPLVIDIMKNYNCDGTVGSIIKNFKNIDLSLYFDVNNFKLVHFGACGSYSPIFALRTYLMKYIATQYSRYFW